MQLVRTDRQLVSTDSTVRAAKRMESPASGWEGAADSRDLARAGLVVLLGVAAMAHIPVISEHLEEAPYMGDLFVGFTIACLALAVVVAFWDNRYAYFSAACLCGAAVLTYVATRIVAFPQIGHDVGNWFETAGVVSVLSELCVVAVALLLARRALTPQR